MIKDYRKIYKSFVSKDDTASEMFPTIIPNWDHTPRSGRGGRVVTHSTPKYFGKHVRDVLAVVGEKPEERQVVFLKSWNEWGEGNYMEPDLKYGTAYLEELSKTLL